jgi:hypothetical protein
MTDKGMRGWVLVLLVVLVGGLLPTSGWAQASPAPAETSSPDASDALAGVGAVLGTIIFLPFKALLICPGMALASGVTAAVNWDWTAQSESLLREGCGGSFAASPGMVQGQQSFQGAGGPYPFTER